MERKRNKKLRSNYQFGLLVFAENRELRRS